MCGWSWEGAGGAAVSLGGVGAAPARPRGAGGGRAGGCGGPGAGPAASLPADRAAFSLFW